MKFNVVIPARRGSTRLPDKVLLPIAGRPMIAHVCAAAQQSDAECVVVATDDREIAALAGKAGVDVALTRSDHDCGTDRIAQAVSDSGWADDVIVINVQADEPLMPSALIDQVAGALHDAPGADIATACTPIVSHAEFVNPNAVKVVCDRRGRALYFSRSPIPYHRASGNKTLTGSVARHLGIYAYRVGALKRFSASSAGILEQIESLEQLRAFDLGMTIQVVEAEQVPGPGVDTAEDLALVERQLRAVQAVP